MFISLGLKKKTWKMEIRGNVLKNKHLAAGSVDNLMVVSLK